MSLDADEEVLREFFEATGGKDKWILGVAEFGTRLQPPPPPVDHAPEIEERLEQEKEPLPPDVSFLDFQHFERNVPETLEMEKYREGGELKERAKACKKTYDDLKKQLANDSTACHVLAYGPALC